MHKTHIFDQKNNNKKKISDLPTLFFLGPLQETNNFFFKAQSHNNSFRSWTISFGKVTHKNTKKVLDNWYV